jgi:hypothetical protein
LHGKKGGERKKIYEYVTYLNVIPDYLKSGMQGIHAERKIAGKTLGKQEHTRIRISLQNTLSVHWTETAEL